MDANLHHRPDVLQEAALKQIDTIISFNPSNKPNYKSLPYIRV